MLSQVALYFLFLKTVKNMETAGFVSKTFVQYSCVLDSVWNCSTGKMVNVSPFNCYSHMLIICY